MKLSDYVQMLKAKGTAEKAALAEVKKLVKDEGAVWTIAKKKIFDKAWTAAKTASVKPVKQLAERGQGGTGEQRLKFLQTALKECKFDKGAWGAYGLHARKDGSEKRPALFKQALDILTKHGFVQVHRLPSSSDFADLKSSRAVTFYSDKYGNSINTVSQKSENGKNDFYILNVNPKYTSSDRSKLDPYAAELEKKYQAALDKVKSGGKVKQPREKTEAWQMTLKEFTRQLKTNASIRSARPEVGDIQDQWVAEIEKALKAGKKLSPEIQTEYTQYAKTSGAVYKLPIGPGKKFTAITIDPVKLIRIKRNLKHGKNVAVTADSGQKFYLSKEPTETGLECGANLKTAVNCWPLYATKK
jgi:hypothetical protein